MESHKKINPEAPSLEIDLIFSPDRTFQDGRSDFNSSRFMYNGEAIMQTNRLTIWALVILVASVTLSGCVTTFTSSGQLQVGLTQSANESLPDVLADFETSEESGVAGDVTKKSSSSCAGGVCTIY